MKDIDVLVIVAHPDDAELACGGTIAKLTKEGKSVVIVDMTKGELGTRGTADIRMKESSEAAKILNIIDRKNLEIPDGNIETNEENTIKTIQVIRYYRPKIIVMNPAFERHPDHQNAHNLVRNSIFKSGLTKVKTFYQSEEQTPYRTRKMYSFMQSYHFEKRPDFCVDITDTFSIKMNAIKAYSSQVYVPGKSDSSEPTTRLSRPEFIEELESRAIHYGTLVGVRYAEPFLAIEPIMVSSMSLFLE